MSFAILIVMKPVSPSVPSDISSIVYDRQESQERLRRCKRKLALGFANFQQRRNRPDRELAADDCNSVFVILYDDYIHMLHGIVMEQKI